MKLIRSGGLAVWRSGGALLFSALLPLAGQAQQAPLPRRQLEAQVFQRFVNKVSIDMGLDAAGRTRLEQHLRVSGEQRRTLAQQATMLRRGLVQSVRDSASTDAQIEKLLADFSALRAREAELWKRDQEALDRLLTPRQHAIFVLQWTQFNERLRDMVQGRRPGGPVGPPR